MRITMTINCDKITKETKDLIVKTIIENIYLNNIKDA